MRTFLSEDILSLSDSVAMASSAELRLPFLDRDLVEFALRLRPRLRTRILPGGSGTKTILRMWARLNGLNSVVAPGKRSFNYGSIRRLLPLREDPIRGLVLGSGAVRRALPGIEPWLRNPPDFFHGPREGTLWAVLALAIWCESAGVG